MDIRQNKTSSKRGDTMTMIKTQSKEKSKNPMVKIMLIAIAVIVIGAVSVFAGFNPVQESSSSKITIFTEDGFMEVTTDKTLVEQILEDADITIDDKYQRVYPALDQELESDYITITNGASIVLRVDGEEFVIVSWAETVAELLAEQSIEIDGDMMNLSLDEPLQSGQEIEIIRVNTELVYEELSMPSKVTFKNDSTLALGTEKVHTQPKEGTKRLTYEITYHDGVEVSRIIVSEDIITEPVVGISLRGTLASVSRGGSRVTVPSQSPEPSKLGTNNAVEGIASYYGAELHGNFTASGVPFDKNALTAAHLTLPFGTKVKVTHLVTGKSVIVVINDRGPHIAGRIIDLSTAAAREIGVYPGIAKVRIEVLK